MFCQKVNQCLLICAFRNRVYNEEVSAICHIELASD